MEEPSTPPTAVKRWLIAAVVLAVVTTITVAVYVTILLDAIETTWLAPRLMQLAVYLLAIASAAVANRYNSEHGTAKVQAHIDRRAEEARGQIKHAVHLAEQRMRARSVGIAKAVNRAGDQIEDNTGELRRIGGEYEIIGYSRGYADGRAGNRPNPDMPTSPEARATSYDEGWADGAAGRPLKSNNNVKQIRPQG